VRFSRSEPVFYWSTGSRRLSGILTEAQAGWFYKRNLSADNLVKQPDGSALARASFGPMEVVSAIPSHADLGGGQRLLTLAGDGRFDVAQLDDPDPGFFKRSADEGFEPFRRFQSLPQLDWTDPNLRFIDLTGDGLADILITEDGIFTFYPSLGEEGFDVAREVRVPWDEEKGPTVVIADGTGTIYLADMSGDGLNDLVRLLRRALPFLLDLQDPDRPASKDDAWICLDVVDHQYVEWIAVFRLGRGDETSGRPKAAARRVVRSRYRPIQNPIGQGQVALSTRKRPGVPPGHQPGVAGRDASDSIRACCLSSAQNSDGIFACSEL
jgi:hypothetical protein